MAGDIMVIERIAAIAQDWFLDEEAMFMAFCTHRVVENRRMGCPLRVGKGVLEVNPLLCRDMGNKELEERMMVEMVRILLKHPYERQPEGCSDTARALASNCVVGDAYEMDWIKIEHPEDFGLTGSGHYEFYARAIERLMEKRDAAGGDGEVNMDGRRTSADLAANWQQDELMSAQINEAIRNMGSWGSLPGGLVERIVASTKARIDYRKVLAGFRAMVLAQARRLTRMRPNRRAGFQAMGSRFAFTTRLLVGVDVSGSITKEDLQNFYSTINHFFQYGIQSIDVVQFDTKLGEVQTIAVASEMVKVTGRGGTDFQPFVDYVASHPEYDGAIIYTDGYAREPSVPPSLRTPLCWIVRSEKELDQHEKWMSRSGRVCVIENER